MAFGPSEPESPADGLEKGPRAPSSVDRREMIKRAIAMGLQSMAIAGAVSGAARSARATEDCGGFNPETGGVYPDFNCATTVNTADYDCARPRDGAGNYWSDGHCGVGGPPNNVDADCGSQTGTAPGGGAYFQADNNCQPQPNYDADGDCTLPSNPVGTPHADNDGQ